MKPDGASDGGSPFARRRHPAPDFEPAHVAALFDRNAATYDRINTVITFGLDAAWRRWAAREAVPAAGAVSSSASTGVAAAAGSSSLPHAGSAASSRRPLVLDACAGTGLLARDLARRGARVTAADAAPGMLAVARARLAGAGLAVRLVVADLTDAQAAAALGGPFDAITVGFGLRYFADPAAVLRPLRELLAPGGRLVVVEAVGPPGTSAERRPASTSSRSPRASARHWHAAPSSTGSSPTRRAPWARATTSPPIWAEPALRSLPGGASPVASPPASSPYRRRRR